MKHSRNQARRAGFTLVEIMVATVISLVIVLGVVTIANSAINGYTKAMNAVSTTAVSRQVLDTLENDLRSAVIKNDGNVWLECLTGTPDPTANSNIEPGAAKSLILFSTPTDRDVYKPGMTGAARRPYKGDVSAVRYRLTNDSPLPAGLRSDDKAYSLLRVIVNPEDTYSQVLKESADITNTRTLPQILGSITVDSGTPAARSIRENSPQDIYGMNVVGMTPVFIFKRTDPTRTPSTWYFYAAPRSTVNDKFFQEHLRQGYGSRNDSQSFAIESFDNIKITDGKYAIDSGAKPTPDSAAWREGTLVGALVSLTVVDDAGAEKIRAAQTRSGNGKIPEQEWNQIIQEHANNFVRHISLPSQ